jgi:hypothetical protein
MLGVGALVAALIAFAGCGGDDSDDSADAPPPAARPADFPDPAGKTIAQLRQELPPGGLVLAPTGRPDRYSQLEPGRNRFGFGLFDRTQRQIADAPTAVYAAPAGGGEVRGPFPARYESLDVTAQFQSAGVRADPDAARTVYVSDIEFRRPGRYELLGVVRLDDRLVAATPASGAVHVVKDSFVPEVGDPAPRTETPTLNDVGGDVEQIDTRVPPSTMHEEDFAEVVGEKPAVLLFATPALCQSRVCGPVVDIAEQVKAQHEGEDIAWIHMEVFVDNTVEKGYRPQLRDWRLPSEPWIFTVDGSGRVAARMEGAFSADELERAVDAAVRG